MFAGLRHMTGDYDKVYCQPRFTSMNKHIMLSDLIQSLVNFFKSTYLTTSESFNSPTSRTKVSQNVSGCCTKQILFNVTKFTA